MVCFSGWPLIDLKCYNSNICILMYMYLLYVLRPCQHFFNHVGTLSCVPVLRQDSTEDKVSCSRRQNCASCKSRNCDPSIPSKILHH